MWVKNNNIDKPSMNSLQLTVLHKNDSYTEETTQMESSWRRVTAITGNRGDLRICHIHYLKKKILMEGEREFFFIHMKGCSISPYKSLCKTYRLTTFLWERNNMSFWCLDRQRNSTGWLDQLYVAFTQTFHLEEMQLIFIKK